MIICDNYFNETNVEKELREKVKKFRKARFEEDYLYDFFIFDVVGEFFKEKEIQYHIIVADFSDYEVKVFTVCWIESGALHSRTYYVKDYVF